MTLPRNVRDRIAELSTALSSGQWNASTMAETLGSRGDSRHNITGLLGEINRGGRNLTQFATYNTMSDEDKGAIAAYQTNYNNLATFVARYGIDRNELAGMLGAAGFNQHTTNDNAIGGRANDLAGRIAGGIEVERQRAAAQPRPAAADEPEHRTLSRAQRSQLHERINNLSSMMWNASALATDGDGPNANITSLLREINHGQGRRHFGGYAAYNTLSEYDKQGLAAYEHAYNELANYVRPLGISTNELAGYLDQSGMSAANANDGGINARASALEASLTREITGTASTSGRPATARPAARPAPARPAPAAPAVARDREEEPARPTRRASAAAPEPATTARVATDTGSEPPAREASPETPARAAAAPADSTTAPAPERPAAGGTRSYTRGAGAPPEGTLQAQLLDVGVRISQGKTDPAVVAAVEAFYRSTGERPMEGLGTLSETEITAVLNRMQSAAFTPGQHDELRALGTALGITMTTLPAEAAPAAPATPAQPDQPVRGGPPTR